MFKLFKRKNNKEIMKLNIRKTGGQKMETRFATFATVFGQRKPLNN